MISDHCYRIPVSTIIILVGDEMGVCTAFSRAGVGKHDMSKSGHVSTGVHGAVQLCDALCDEPVI